MMDSRWKKSLNDENGMDDWMNFMDSSMGSGSVCTATRENRALSIEGYSDRLSSLLGFGKEAPLKNLENLEGRYIFQSIDGWMDGWMYGWMDGWTIGRLDGWMDGRLDDWMDGWMDDWTIGRTDGQADGGSDGWTDEWMDDGMDGRKDGRTVG